MTENAMIHLRVEENSCTSCVGWVSVLGATAIEEILSYGTKTTAWMQKTESADAVID
jgi:hypothetical protein